MRARPEAEGVARAGCAVDGRGQGLCFFGKMDAHDPVHTGLERVLDCSASRVLVCGCQFRGGCEELDLVRVGPAELELELLGFERGVTDCSPVAPRG